MGKRREELGGGDPWRAAKVGTLYAGTSIAVSMLYKAVLSSFQFEAKMTLLVIQLSISLCFCLFARAFLGGVAGLEVPPFSWETYKRSVLMSVVFVLNIGAGWYGLAVVDVPTFLCIRRTAVVFTMLVQWWYTGVVEKWSVQTCVLVIVLGTVLAGWDSLGSDWVGYLFTLANNVLTGFGLSMTRNFKEKTGVTGFGIVYYTALTALPLSLLLAVVNGEHTYLLSYPHLHSTSFLLAVFISSAAGTFMTYVVFLSATVNSPLATSVAGNLKDVLSSVIGALLFPGFEPTAKKIAGLAVSLSGGATFAFLKYKQMTQKKDKDTDTDQGAAADATSESTTTKSTTEHPHSITNPTSPQSSPTSSSSSSSSARAPHLPTTPTPTSPSTPPSTGLSARHPIPTARGGSEGDRGDEV